LRTNSRARPRSWPALLLLMVVVLLLLLLPRQRPERPDACAHASR
jgi:hypothetical protein